MKTRKQYIAKEITHKEFYGQFVTESVKKAVLCKISKTRLLASTDPHLNDIPLSEWDNLYPVMFQITAREVARANESSGVSLSDMVCVAKAAARQIIEEG